MQVKQRFNLLIYLKRTKQNHDGCPVYIRITIDGLRDEISINERVQPKDWNLETKLVLPTAHNHREINDKINAARVDIKRHFEVLQLSKGIVMPEAVKSAYLSPINGKVLTEQKSEYSNFQESLIAFITEYVKWCERWKKVKDQVAELPAIKQAQLDQETIQYKKRIELFDKEAFRIYGDKSREKTLAMAIDEYLFNFLKGVHTKTRAYTTLEKWLGRRLRYIAFLKYRYYKNDLPITALEFSFIGDMVNFNKLVHSVDNNTAMNYAKHLKEIIKRAVSHGWLPYNIFEPFACSYVPPKASYLSMEQFIVLKNHVFKKQHLNNIRDIYVFACYTGLSYSELYRLAPEHIITGVDGKLWIDISRLKTGSEEPVPLLPPAILIMEKYKDHPQFLRKRRILPMPTNENWNRCQKEIGEELGFDIDMHGHQTRYFFINVVTYDNDMSLPAIKQMVGHKKLSTTEHYLRNNKKRVSKEMQALKEKLFTDTGELKQEQEQIQPLPTTANGMRVVHLKRV